MIPVQQSRDRAEVRSDEQEQENGHDCQAAPDGGFLHGRGIHTSSKDAQDGQSIDSPSRGVIRLPMDSAVHRKVD
jgi:hypothetical protein